MKDKNKTKPQLIKELETLRKQMVELKEAEIKHTQAEEELQTGEEKYRSLLEGSRDAIYVTTLAG
ncbi:MAG: hypothetical protein OEW69_08975, partial [Nitrospirota bacterium]|nr:hypothetical protein [Nitrospirota bacterium]